MLDGKNVRCSGVTTTNKQMHIVGSDAETIFKHFMHETLELGDNRFLIGLSNFFLQLLALILDLVILQVSEVDLIQLTFGNRNFGIEFK